MTILSFSTVSVMVIPQSDAEILDYAKANIGEYDPVFEWTMPVYKGDTIYVYNRVNMTYEMDISDGEYRKSMFSSEFRLKTVFEETACTMVQPNEPHVMAIAGYISGLTAGQNDYQRVNTALYFVQSAIAYKTDDALYGQTERWATPLETLYAHAGDCEDVAVLFTSIIIAMGYDAVLLQYDGHVAAAVDLGDYNTGKKYSCYGREYTFCECAADECLIQAGRGLSAKYYMEEPDLVKPHRHASAFLMGNAYYVVRNLVNYVTGI